MDIKRWKVMLAVDDYGSFTRAGEALGYTQSGVTQMMKALEKEVGFSLFIKGKKGAQAGIAALALEVDLCTANNTVAIVMAGPIAKEISDEYGVDPKRSASLLDMFTSVGQGLIPYGAQLLSAATLTGLTPFEIIPHTVYPVLMAVCGIIAILLQKK